MLASVFRNLFGKRPRLEADPVETNGGSRAKPCKPMYGKAMFRRRYPGKSSAARLFTKPSGALPFLSRRALMAAAPAAALAASAFGAEKPRGLRDIAETRGLAFGSMVRGRLLPGDRAYADMMARECDLFVCREAHFDYLQKKEGTFDFSQPDRDLAWAEAHGMRFRATALLWGEHVPSWFAAITDRAAGVRAVRDHIAAVCRHFAGRVQSWDVVNEAIKLEHGRPDGLRRTAFLDLIGPEYLDIAFRAAREADPQAKLTYNDFGVELDVPWQRDRRRVLLEMLDGFKKRGVPVDIVGIQSHLTTDTIGQFNDKVFADFLRALSDRGVAVLLSELDVGDRRAPAAIAPRDAEVAAAYRRYLDAALAGKAVTGVVSWGLTDKDNWVNSPENRNRRTDGLAARPLPFDVDYLPKPAYAAVAAALNAAPQR
jgi:endo-1,4-beta-xylanase